MLVFATAVIAVVFSTLPIAQPGPESGVERERLIETLQSIPTKRSGFGDDEHIAGLTKTRTMIVDRLRQLGYEPTLMPVTWSRRGEKPPVTPRDWANVVVEIAGQSEALKREVIIVGAHFDTVPDTPGADDNGTGTAALLEIARVLKDQRLQRTVRLVFFDLEEAGLIGARQYAAGVRDEVKAATIDVVLMLSVEMIGYFSDEPGSQRNPFKGVPGGPQATVADFIALCGHSRDKAVVAQLEKAMNEAEPSLKTLRVDGFPNETIPLMPPDLLRSDHAPFLLSQMPAVMVTDTSEFRNANYHQPTDTVETLDPVRYTQATRAIAGAVWRLAGPLGSDAPALRRGDK